MSRSRLAPESLKRVSNLIPGILVPDSHRGTNSPRLSYYINDVSLVRCYVDEKSDSISTLAGYYLENFAFRYNSLRFYFLLYSRKKRDRSSSRPWNSRIRWKLGRGYRWICEPRLAHKSRPSRWLAIFIRRPSSTHTRVLNNISLPVHLVPRKCFALYVHAPPEFRGM